MNNAIDSRQLRLFDGCRHATLFHIFFTPCRHIFFCRCLIDAMPALLSILPLSRLRFFDAAV